MSISPIGESISTPVVASAILPVSGHAGQASTLPAIAARPDDPAVANGSAATPQVQSATIAPAPAAAAVEAVGAPAPAPPSPDPRVKTVADTVDLSQQAQIKLLSEQGQTPADIAARLGLNVSEVQGDLFISPTASAAAEAAAQAATSAKSAAAAAEAAATQLATAALSKAA